MEQNEKKYVEGIIKEYSEKGEDDKLTALKKLDRKVRLFPQILAYSIGIAFALLLGFGMSVIMCELLPGYLWVGYLCGIIGLLMVSLNYFIYKAIMNSRKNKYRELIIKLSSELIYD